MINLKPPDNLPPITEFDPLGDRLLVEAYLFLIEYDVVESQLRLLFGTWTGLAEPVPGNLGLLVCNGVSEFGWKVEEWGRPKPPHWWTVVGQHFLGPDDKPRVEIDQTPPMPGGPLPPLPDALGESRYRYEIALVPNATMIISFDTVDYYLATQEGIEEDVTFRAEREVRWHSVSSWPAVRGRKQ